MKIAIVTDSVADLPSALCAELGIAVVPLSVIFGDEVLKDGVDITSSQFFARLKSSSVMPSTSQPSPADFMEVYKGLELTHDHVFSIHVSSHLSGTYQSACIARDTMQATSIEVIDTGQATMCEGLIVLAAARAAARGAGVEEIRQRIKAVAGSVRMLFGVSTLEFLARNGRIGRAASLVGALLSVKPILHVEDGIVAPYDKVLGERKILGRTIQIMHREVGQEPITAAIVHADSEDKAQEWKREITSNFNCSELTLCEVGPVVGTHAGPGAVGVTWHPTFE